jgi:hypothetical protein
MSKSVGVQDYIEGAVSVEDEIVDVLPPNSDILACSPPNIVLTSAMFSGEKRGRFFSIIAASTRIASIEFCLLTQSGGFSIATAIRPMRESLE